MSPEVTAEFASTPVNRNNQSARRSAKLEPEKLVEQPIETEIGSISIESTDKAEIIAALGSAGLQVEAISVNGREDDLPPESKAEETVFIAKDWTQTLSASLATMLEEIIPTGRNDEPSEDNPTISINAEGNVTVLGSTLELSNNLDKLIINLLLAGEEFSSADIKGLFGPNVTKEQDGLISRAINRVRRGFDDLVISKGKTGSITYRLSSDAQIVDARTAPTDNLQPGKLIARKSNPADSNSADPSLEHQPKDRTKTERLSYELRGNYIDQIVKFYQNERTVNKALHAYKDRSVDAGFNENPLTQYSHEIIKYPLLSADDEKVLFGAIDKGLEFYAESDGKDLSTEQEKVLIDMTIAYYKILYSNLRLVILANKPRFRKENSAVDPLDYVQEGNIALDLAIKRFDIGMGFKFSTYAMWWLKQRSQRAHNKYHRSIYIPQKVNNDWIEINRTEDELAEELKRQPTISEIAQSINRTPEQVAEIIRYGTQNLISLDKPVGADGVDSIGDMVTSSSEEDRQNKFINHDLLESIIKKANLDQAELLHLSLRFHVYINSLSGTKLLTEDGVKLYDTVFDELDPDKIATFREMRRLIGTNEVRIRKDDRLLMYKIKNHLGA